MNTANDTHWRDAKRYLWALGLLVPLFPIIGAAIYVVSGQIWGWWFAPLMVYLIIPLMDLLVGTDRSNPPESAVPQLEADAYYRYIVYAYIPLQYAGTLIAVWFACTELGAWGIAGALLSCACCQRPHGNIAIKSSFSSMSYGSIPRRSTMSPPPSSRSWIA